MSVAWKDHARKVMQAEGNALIAVILNAPEGHASAITSRNLGTPGKQLKPI